MPSIAGIIEFAHVSYHFLKKIGVEFPKAVSILFVDHFIHVTFVWTVALLWMGYKTGWTGITFNEFAYRASILYILVAVLVLTAIVILRRFTRYLWRTFLHIVDLLRGPPSSVNPFPFA